MYPNSALVGGGTRDYYPNEVTRATQQTLRAARRIGLLAAVARILALGRKGPGRAAQEATRTSPPGSPARPVVLPETPVASGKEWIAEVAAGEGDAEDEAVATTAAPTTVGG